MESVELDFSEDALKEIAKKAIEMLKKWNLFDDSMEIRKTKYLRRLESL